MRAGRLVGVLGGWYTLRSKIQVGRNERRVTWGTILGPNASDARAEICCLCRTSAARGRPSTTRRGCAATLHAGSTSRYATATFTLTSPSAAAPCTRPGPGSTLNGPHPSTPSFPPSRDAEVTRSPWAGQPHMIASQLRHGLRLRPQEGRVVNPPLRSTWEIPVGGLAAACPGAA